MIKSVLKQTYFRAKRLSAKKEMKRFIAGSGPKCLNVGSQTNRIQGWLNVDIAPFPGCTYMDATARWPLPDNSIDIILCEHMIEHVPKPQGLFALTEAFRVLKNGGVIRLVTPNLSRFATMALSPESKDALAYREFFRGKYDPKATVCDMVNGIFYGYGHRYIYSPEELGAMLTQIGFTKLVNTEAGVPNDQRFAGKEGHPALLGHELNAIEAFAMESTRP